MNDPQNFFTTDAALEAVLDRLMAPDDAAWLRPHLKEMGHVAATELDDLARVADKNPPTLRQWDASGDRVDAVDYHPAYREMEKIAYSRFGLAAMSHREGILGREGRGRHLTKYALSYLFSQSEFGLACPLSMTDSAARVLRLFDPENFGEVIERLTTTDMDHHWTGAMFMTERVGGSDIGQTETQAVQREGHWELTGRKWFASNVSADVILTLAIVPGQGKGTRGLGLFYVPRVKPDGSKNDFTIDRLKDKLGTRSMASGEVTLHGAWARPVGDLTRGFRQMAEMVNVSRLSNSMRSAAMMRRGVREAVNHTRERIAFGELLFDKPLMRVSLLPLVLEAETAINVIMETAATLDAADAGDDDARRLARIMTPLVKFTLCKDARHVTGETMEIRGGNGYIEDWIDPKLLRDAHLSSIWEGSSNVIALDVLRCLRKEGLHRHLAEWQLGRLAALDVGDTAGAVAWLETRWRALAARGDAILASEPFRQEAAMARYSRDLGETMMATSIVVQAAHDLATHGDARSLLVSYATILRMDGHHDDELHSALEHLGAIVDGGGVPLSAVKELLDDAGWTARG